MCGWELGRVHLPPTAGLQVAKANPVRLCALPVLLTAQLPPPSGLPRGPAAPPADDWADACVSNSSLQTAHAFPSLACLTDFGFAQGPGVPAPRLASLPSSRSRRGTMVSASTSLPGVRARAWQASRALGAKSSEPQFPRSVQIREEVWPMDELVLDHRAVVKSGRSAALPLPLSANFSTHLRRRPDHTLDLCRLPH